MALLIHLHACSAIEVVGSLHPHWDWARMAVQHGICARSRRIGSHAYTLCPWSHQVAYMFATHVHGSTIPTKLKLTSSNWPQAYNHPPHHARTCKPAALHGSSMRLELYITGVRTLGGLRVWPSAYVNLTGHCWCIRATKCGLGPVCTTITTVSAQWWVWGPRPYQARARNACRPVC